MQLKLLGPPELVDANESLHLGGPRQQIVLAMLALSPNRVVSLERLIEAVWGDAPPATARSQIQICISGLRRIFADTGRSDAIATRASGYQLSIGVDELDITRFAQLVAEARQLADRQLPAEAADELGAALALWRGPALMGVASDVAQRAALQLDEQRLVALEERLRLDLMLNRHDEIIGELYDLVEREPLRERLHGTLMLALYRAGRQAEALDCYRRMRTILVDELGMDPSKDLQQLEAAILAQDSSLDLHDEADDPDVAVEALPVGPLSAVPAPLTTPPVPAASATPRQLPSDIADFAGRDHQLLEVGRCLGVAADDSPTRYSVPVLSISGMGGVGKSALAVRAAHELSEIYCDGQLYASMHGITGAAGSSEVLSSFLRALGVAGTAMPDSLPERMSVYRSRLAGRRILILLDDVGDERLVQSLLPGSPGCAVIVTSRARLTGLPGAHHIKLDVFDNALSVDLLGRIAGQERIRAQLPDAVQLATFCAGLPLALRIAGARLAHRPHWRVAKLVRRLEDEASRLDQFEHGGLGLRTTIGFAYAAADERARRLFRLLAVIEASDCVSWTAAALLDADVTEAEDVLESLVDDQLLDVVSVPGGAPRYRLHELIRVYARERLAEEESSEQAKAAIERALSGWLALAQEAHRRDYGGDFTILRSSVPVWQLPAAESAELVRIPIVWWESERRALVAAVRQAAGLGLDELCWNLAMISVTLFESRAYFDDWRETSELAYETARKAGNRRGAAAMLYSLGTLKMFQQHLAEAEENFTAAAEILRAEGDEHGTMLVLRNMAQVDWLRGNHAEMLVKYQRALQGLRATGDRAAEAHVLYNIAKSQINAEDYEQATETLRAALAICWDINCVRVEAQVTYRLGELRLRLGDLEPAVEAFNRTLELVRDAHDQIGECHALYGLGRGYHLRGRADEAESCLIQALSLSRQIRERLMEGLVLHTLGELAQAGGTYSAALVRLKSAGEVFEQLGVRLWQARNRLALLRIHQATGNTSAARDEERAITVLLTGIDSREADRVRTDLRRARCLVAHGQVA
jgi:DNA-binding SARP family transcriptional activator